MEHTTYLLDKVKNAPYGPGCYLYYDSLGNVIYVGKAKILRKRVGQYFQNKPLDEKTQQLVSLITDVTYKETTSELDALILEYQLIKEYKPWFNIQLKRDRERPMLEIDLSQLYYTISAANQRNKADAVYLDCFLDKKQITEALDLLNKVWKIPVCQKTAFVEEGTPCFNYHLDRCLGPCSGNVSLKQYQEELDDLVRFFDCQDSHAINHLEQQIKVHTEALEFERADELNQIHLALKKLQAKSRKIFTFPDKKKFLLFIRPYRSEEFSIFLIRNGETVLRQDFNNNLDEKKLNHFLNKINERQPQLIGNHLTKCLAEIYVEKHYIEILPRKRQRWIQTEIEKVYAEIF